MLHSSVRLGCLLRPPRSSSRCRAAAAVVSAHSPAAAAAPAPQPQTWPLPPPPPPLLPSQQQLQPRRHICRAAGSPSQQVSRTAAARPAAPQQQQRAAASKAGPAGAAAAAGDTWLIVGLGNPGPRYEKTRHNVGFLVIDTIARSAGIDMRKLEKSAAVGRGELHGRKIVLAKPVTFMNNSGESVSALARFYKIPQQRVLVISDDLDQPTAAVRFRMKGGHGGHNGLRSIMQHFGGSQDFPRLKIGIGRPEGQMDVASYVLQEFRRSEMEAISQAIDESIRVVESCLALGLEKAASGSRL